MRNAENEGRSSSLTVGAREAITGVGETFLVAVEWKLNINLFEGGCKALTCLWNKRRHCVSLLKTKNVKAREVVYDYGPYL